MLTVTIKFIMLSVVVPSGLMISTYTLIDSQLMSVQEPSTMNIIIIGNPP